MHCALACLVLFVLAGYAWWMRGSPQADGLPGALLGVTLAAPCILLLWLARGAFYVRLSPQYAVLGAATYSAFVGLGLLIAYKAKSLSPFSAFLIMAIAAGIASLCLLSLLKPTFRFSTIAMHSVLSEHWQYGRWILLSSLLGWITGDIYYPLVATFAGLGAAGELKALLNFSMPITQTLNALSVFVLPHAARVFSERGPAALTRFTWRLTALFAVGAILYWLVLILLSGSVIRLFYGTRYSELRPLLPLVAASSVPWTVAYVPATTLRAVRSSASVMMMYLVSSAVALVAGVPVTRSFGLHGALWVMVLSNVSTFVIASVLARRKMRAQALV